MYTLSEQQIDHILNDIKLRGVEMEDLQLNLLDHICCIIESELDQGGDFQSLYEKTISKFFKKELKEIEEETIYLLTFKNYYAMKKTMIVSGIISTGAFLFGSFLKLMHWPGAAVMLVTGVVLFSFLFLPLMVVLKNKEADSLRDKITIALGSLVGFLFCMGTLFKIMHWPAAMIMIESSLIISITLFIPIYFFTGIRKPETKVNTIVSTILMIIATGMPFMLINVRPAQKSLQINMYSYLQREDLLKKLQSRTGENNTVTDINAKCEQIKSMILENSIGMTSIPKDFEDKKVLMEEGGLGPDFSNSSQGIQLFKGLKTEITAYNSSLSPENKIPIEHSILEIEPENIERYSNYSVLNNITQLQLFIANAEMK